ncbi:ribonuclease H family protein [Thalassotalea ganghwensis]
MAKKYYVIWKGEKTGVFDDWATVKSLTQGRADAQFMGFSSKQAAEAAFKQSYTKALISRSKSTTPIKNSSAKETTSTVSKSKAELQIYSDGACSPNPGQAGTGLAVYHKGELKALWYGLYDPMGTNNTAELNGLLASFKLANKYLDNVNSIEILSDSRYSIDSITKWAAGWQKKGWKKANGEAIKNPELVKTIYELYLTLKKHITVTYVKGHANIEGNELADRMAVYARKTKERNLVRYNDSLDVKTILAMESG